MTAVEEMLIARCIPTFSVFRLKGGSLGYRGNVLTLHQDIGNLATRLPRTVDSLRNNVLVVLKQCVNRANNTVFESTFKASRTVVHRVLDFVMHFHRHYVHVVNVDADNIRQPGENENVLLSLAMVQRNMSHDRQDTGCESDDEVGPDQGYVDRSSALFHTARDGQAMPIRITEAELIRQAILGGVGGQCSNQMDTVPVGWVTIQLNGPGRCHSQYLNSAPSVSFPCAIPGSFLMDLGIQLMIQGDWCL